MMIKYISNTGTLSDILYNKTNHMSLPYNKNEVTYGYND